MCIRDSTLPAARQHAAVATLNWALYPAEKSSARLNIANAPVSYTHLRAHETELDLVCRLLLEKKTTNDERDGVSQGHHGDSSKHD